LNIWKSHGIGNIGRRLVGHVCGRRHRARSDAKLGHSCRLSSSTMGTIGGRGARHWIKESMMCPRPRQGTLGWSAKDAKLVWSRIRLTLRPLTHKRFSKDRAQVVDSGGSAQSIFWVMPHTIGIADPATSSSLRQSATWTWLALNTRRLSLLPTSSVLVQGAAI
jgi:hypothetical protein